MSTPYNYTCELNLELVSAINTNNWTLAYLSICLSCSIWQIINSLHLTWIAHKPVHGVVLFQSIISFVSILFSLLNPLTRLNCDVVSKRPASSYSTCQYSNLISSVTGFPSLLLISEAFVFNPSCYTRHTSVTREPDGYWGLVL
jgi:hypothetical protein